MTTQLTTLVAQTSKGYFQRALDAFSHLGLRLENEPDSPMLTLISQVADYDQVRLGAIAQTLQRSSEFNAMVRDQIDGMEISTRFADITKRFDSVREDAKDMVQWLEDGKLSFSERAQLKWVKLRRGSIPDRFSDIKGLYVDVMKSANEQVQREKAILAAYQEFRFALKEAEVAANEVLVVAENALAGKDQALIKAQAAVDAADLAPAERSLLELARDEALRDKKVEEGRYQIIKDLADNLKVSYNASETVFSRLNQVMDVKTRVIQQAVSFFSTNEIVFTAMSSSFTSMQGLGEATNTLEAMKDGMNKGLEDLAGLGNKQLEAGLRAGYGATLSVKSVSALIESIVAYQENSVTLIAQLRKEATDNAAEMERIVEDGKRRYVALVQKAGK